MMERMRGLSVGAVVVSCGAAFGAGWAVGVFTGSPGIPSGERTPAPRPAPAVPEPRGPEMPVSAPPPAPRREEPRPWPEAYRDEPLPSDDFEPSAAPIDPERPVRTQGDVMAAVRAALEQDRAERDLRERRLREGPYGEFNYDVNRMAERLPGMTDMQKGEYAALLKWRRDQRDALERRLDAKEITRTEFDAGQREIGEYLLQRMRQVLNEQQYEQYQAYLRSRRGFWGR